MTKRTREQAEGAVRAGMAMLRTVHQSLDDLSPEAYPVGAAVTVDVEYEGESIKGEGKILAWSGGIATIKVGKKTILTDCGGITKFLRARA